MLERLLFLLQSRGRSAKAGVLFIVLGAVVLFAILVIGLVSTLGNVALIATQTRTVIDFLETGLGIFVGLAVAVFLILLGFCFLLFLAPQPSDASPASASYSDLSQREQLEQLRTKLREVEQERNDLKGRLARLQNEATSPEVAKQKRLCFHLADDLRRLYREFQDGESMLIAHLQEQEEANIPEAEREEERHTKQLDLENKMRNKYHWGFPDRLEKLYEELEPGGWLGPNDETLFMNLTDPNDIKKVADRLEEVGRNLL